MARFLRSGWRGLARLAASPARHLALACFDSSGRVDDRCRTGERVTGVFAVTVSHGRTLSVLPGRIPGLRREAAYFARRQLQEVFIPERPQNGPYRLATRLVEDLLGAVYTGPDDRGD